MKFIKYYAATNLNLPTYQAIEIDKDIQNDQPQLISSVPLEVLQHILKYLPLTELIKCREVCSRWRMAVNDIMNISGYWRKACERDYRDVYKQAKLKANKDLSWCDLYKSFYLWRNIDTAAERWSLIEERKDCDNADLFISYVSAYNEVVRLHCYASLDTQTYIESLLIQETDCFPDYETENVIVYTMFTYRSELDSKPVRDIWIVPKLDEIPDRDNAIIINYSYNHVIKDDILYYSKYNDNSDGSYKIFMLDLNYCESVFLSDFYKSIENMNHARNCLNILTKANEIYSFIEGEFKLRGSVTADDGVSLLCKYEFFSRVGYNGKISFLQNSIFLHYGDLLLAVSNRGILRIYDRNAFCSDSRTRPLKKYNLWKIFGRPEYFYDMTSIEVMEKENGHIVFVSTQTQVFALTLTH